MASPIPKHHRYGQQAQLTSKPTLQSPAYHFGQWPGCRPVLPTPPSICMAIHGGSGAAPQPNSWPFAKWIISLFCPHVWPAPLAYASFSPHPGISCAGELQRHARSSRLTPLQPSVLLRYRSAGEKKMEIA